MVLIGWVQEVNSFALWCDNCGAVVVHACDFGKKITGYEVKWDVK